ncbi:uncharacterized protein LOC141899137 [Tubulanus polymorphus]|uniref:uncharacterized protein LOC141899137 n=1 Tax=Tubulanus polymorphus TaxID=672921 RepID=UPI003DA52FFB
MMSSSVQSLANMARDTCVQFLIGEREYYSSDNEDNEDEDEAMEMLSDNNDMGELLAMNLFTAVSESILNRLVDMYPKRLTNVLLWRCAPSHMKKLCLKKCIKLRDYGIQDITKKCKPNDLNLSQCYNGLLRPELISLCSGNLQNLTSFTADNTDISNEAVHSILINLPCVKHLGLSMCHELTDKVFLIREDQLLLERRRSDSLDMLSSLTSVDISGCQMISNMGIRNLVTLCGRTLKHLDFSLTEVDCMSFWYLAGFNFNSAVFLATNIAKLKDQSFENILYKCSNESEAVNSNKENLDKCSTGNENSTVDGGLLETNSVSVESTSNTADVHQHVSSFLPQWAGSNAQGTLPLIQDVKLTASNLPAQNVTDTSLKCDVHGDASSAKSMKQCQENTQSITQSRLKWFEPALISLHAIDIDYSNENLNAICCKAFFLSNPALECIRLSWRNLSDEMLEYIANCCSKLMDISLIECKRVTTTGFSSLGNLCKDIQNLTLPGVFHADNQKAVIPLITSKNEYLDLTSCDITDPVLTAIANNCKHRLVHLNLSECKNITEQGLLEVTGSCHNLRELFLDTTNVTIQVIDSISLNCLALTKLSLNMAREIDDNAVVTLVERLNCLRDLDLSWNANLTDVSLEAILVNCIYLEKLYVAGLKLITSNPLMPIIGDVDAWKKSQAYLEQRIPITEALGPDEEDSFSDDEFKDFPRAYRSTSYAINLRCINLTFCNKMLKDEIQLNEIAYCCGGSLSIIDFYGDEVRNNEEDE